jgi:hypothetical protein
MQRLNLVRRVATIFVAMLVTLPVIAYGGEASAATTTTTKCNARTGVCVTVTCVDGHCTVKVTEPGAPGQPGKPAPPPPDDPCAGELGTDPTTATNPAACAAWQHQEVCLHTQADALQNFGVARVNDLTPAQAAQLNQLLTAAGCATVTTPGTLAEQALRELVLPLPTIGRSPDPHNHIDGASGLPFTWVSIFTWYWSDSAPWRTPPSKTAATPDGAVWATVTATPVSLTFDPGNGDKPVVCAGPGRPWTAADGEQAPTAGGCAYEYLHVVGGAGTVTSTVTMAWTITWKGSGGAGGSFQGQTTQSQSTFLVEQMQVVNR